MSDSKTFLGGIIGKLSVLMGGALSITGAQAATTLPAQPPLPSHELKMDALSSQKPLPAKLLLKQQKSGFKMIAAHASHASHASHSSHSSRAM